MKPRFRQLLIALALCGGLNRAAFAQVAPLPLAPMDQGARMHSIPVKNVPASLMAYWLDPANHPLPVSMQRNNPAANPYLLANPPYLLPNSRDKAAGRVEADKNQQGNKRGKGLDLAAGIDRIVAIDPQNALLVFGTDAGVQELQKVIDALDKPLRQIEIEAQWVQISREDAKAFDIRFNDAPADAQSPQLGFVGVNFGAKLAQLVKANKAVIITAPRVIAINNLAASTSSFLGSDAEIHLKNQGRDLNSLFAGTTQVGTEYTTSFTPTINNDNTVTIEITTAAALKMRTAAGTELVAARPASNIVSIVNVRDGDTIALAGLASTNQNAAQNPPSGLMVFVTARIVRRAEDEAKTVAPKR